jgi:tetratricopeptide (TPR) repeat protein/TolB-like protein
MSRVASRLTTAELPIRSIVTFAAIGALAVIAYLVVEHLVNSVVPGRQTVLVLPPTVDPADTALNVIADGVTDDLIRDLSQVPDLRVVNAVTTFGFRRSAAAPLVLARGMSADVAFQWAIMRNADGIAYTGSLLDSANGKARWTVRQTSSLRGLSGVRHDLTRAILQVLEVTPEAGVQAMLRAMPTEIPEAYDASLLARAMMRRPDLYPPETIVAAFEQVVRLDSTFADAQAGLGWALVLAYEANPTTTPSLLNRAAFCVQRAVAGGTKTSEVFRVWGMMEQFRGNFDKAEERLQEAVAAAPSDAEAQRRLAILLAARGKIDPAVKAARQATADDPGNATSWIALGSARLSKVFFRPEGKDDLRAALQALDQGYRVARDRSEYASGMHADLMVYLDMSDRAMEVLSDRIARSRDSYVDLYKLGRVQQSAGRPKEEWQGTFTRAREVLTASLAASPDDPQVLTSMALVETRLGAFKEATAAIKRALQMAPSDVDVMYGAAKVFALQRDRDQAFEHLRKALARRYSLAQVLDMDFYNLRTDEQFIQTIKK